MENTEPTPDEPKAQASRKRRRPKSAPAVVGRGKTDEVSVSRLIPKNVRAKKSLSVHHLQRRLNELGYSAAYADTDGWLGDGTLLGLRQFAEAEGHEIGDILTFAVILDVFDGDANVTVVP